MWFSASLALAAWPVDATLTPPTPEVPACWTPPRVMISAGHGAPGNHGNTGVWGQREEKVTEDLALDLQRRLAPHVDVVLSRAVGERPSYDQRVERATAADVLWLIELHTDWRGGGTVWADSPYGEVHRHPDAPGFSVLYKHDGPLTDQRQALARALATRLSAMGLPAYDGRDYGTKYDRDEVAGVFRDNRGLLMLRRPTMPSVILEVHHALDPLETLHWRTEPVRAAFAATVLDALIGLRGCP